MEVQREWPTLFKTSSANKEQQWKIEICPVDGSESYVIVSTYGQVGGKQQEQRVTISAGKNIGRSNETSPFQQAQSEAESKWKKQHDKGYSEERGGASKDYKPMLAHSYDEHADKVDFTNAYVQPKLDGQRCIAVRKGDVITLTSRNGKPITTMDHIVEDLLLVMADGQVFDGELYHHDMTFQEIMSNVKKLQETSELIQYHIYDAIAEGGFLGRFNPVVVAIENAKTKSIQAVHTHEVSSADALWDYHEMYTHKGSVARKGYEGVMVRHSGCFYRSGARSQQLLKVKNFQDAEFFVVDVIPGDRSPTHGIFVCETNGVRFNVNPEGPHELKEQYLRDRERLIGKQLTVRYFEMTTSNPPVPRFPSGIAIREDI